MSKPSTAQARAIARFWGMNMALHISEYSNAAFVALARNGWCAPNGKTGVYPNGATYEEHEITPRGLHAMAEAIVRGKLNYDPRP